MDGEVIWKPIHSASGTGMVSAEISQTIALAPPSYGGELLTRRSSVSKLACLLFSGKHNSVSNKGGAVSLGLSWLSTLSFTALWLTGLRDAPSASSLNKTKKKKQFCFALVCTPLDAFSMQSVSVCVWEGVPTKICIHVFQLRVHCVLLLLLFLTICSDFGLLLLHILFLPSEISSSLNSRCRENKNLPFFVCVCFSLLPSESVAKQLSGSAREHGI